MKIARKCFLSFGVFAILQVFFINLTFAQENIQIPKEEIIKGKVTEVLEEGQREIGGYKNFYQVVKVEVLGEVLTIESAQKVAPLQTIVLSKIIIENEPARYQIIDKYRLNNLGYIAIVFVVLVLGLSRWKGLGSLLGLGVSLLVILKFIVPQILNGSDPLFVSILGSLAIMLTTIYLAHGFSRQTSVALLATFITLTIIGILSVIFVAVTNLSGLGSEEAMSLKFGQGQINFKGLLLGGMIIGALGVLDDITTSLSATIFELKKHKPQLSFKELFKSGLTVGREHIASLVNTLVLAYAGASLPIFLFMVLNPQNAPFWSILNSEFIAEEIVRTLAGSIGLVLAVPVTAFLASWVNAKRVFS